MNSITIIGNLGQDPELKHTQGGNAVCKFSVATSYKYKDKETTEWHTVIAWSKLGENCAKYLAKGRKVAVQGRMTYRTWEDTNGTKHKSAEIVAENVEFLSSPAQQGGNGRDDGRNAQTYGRHDMPNSDDHGGGGYGGGDRW